MTVNKNSYPYYDDYDEEKKFHSIMYRPGYTVQTRELNQMQTILQEQTSRFGSSVYKNGSIVVPGGVQVKNNHHLVKIQFTGTTVFDTLTPFIDNLYIRGSEDLYGQVIFMEDENDSGDPVTAYIEYIGGSVFSIGAGLTMYTEDSDGNRTDRGSGLVSGIGVGCIAIIKRGIYFINGQFVIADNQKIIISKYSTNPTSRIGFISSESIITEEEDDTLYSNATGEINYKAPGAHRLKIDVIAKSISVDDVDDADFVELTRVENGLVTKIITESELSNIGDILARRTYEESGNYSVDNFSSVVREHLDDGENNGYLTADNGGDDTKFLVSMKQGMGYVSGYRVKSDGISVVGDKARDTKTVINGVAPVKYENYMLVSDSFGIPYNHIDKAYELHSVPCSGADPLQQTRIGLTRVRHIMRDSGSSNDLRLYVFDTTINEGFSINDVRGIFFNSIPNVTYRGDIAEGTTIFGVQNAASIFPLPNTATRTLRPGGSTQTTYTTSAMYTVQLSAGLAAISVGGINRVFDTKDNISFMISTNDDAGNTVRGEVVSDVTAGSIITGDGTASLSIDLNGVQGIGASDHIIVMAKIIEQQPIEKTKTLNTRTDTIIFDDEAWQELTKVDITRLISVIDTATGNDVINSMRFDTGQKDTFYGIGMIGTIDGRNITAEYDVTYEFFIHGVGDYFSVESYSGIDYGDIPSYISSTGITYELRDCFDFRPSKTITGTMDAASNRNIVSAVDTIRYDLEYYVPRTDKLYVTSEGQFGIVNGISGDDPQEPEIPSNSMHIYTMNIPAYTFSAESIIMKPIDNQRYTMKDIGDLAKRISRVEYYTSLSMLETTALTTQIMDADGRDRFKNGFVADSFKDFVTIDEKNNENKCTLNTLDGALMPQFNDNAASLNIKDIQTASKKGDFIVAPYTEKLIISQVYATGFINVNPYAVYTWVGSMTLKPSRDFWKDTKYIAPIYINQTIDKTNGVKAGTIQSATQRTLRTWNSWTPFSSSSGRSQAWFGTYQNIETTTTTTTTSITESFNQNTVDNVVTVYPIYWMRSIPVKFEINNMKPFTRVYPFFDNKNVSDYCVPDNITNPPPIGELNTLITDSSGKLNGTFTIPSSSSIRFQTGDAEFRVSSSPTNSFGVEVETDASKIFNSQGTMTERQETVTTNRILGISRTSSTSTSRGIQLASRTLRWRDPVAQTFMCTEPGGQFITGIDIFFKSKAVNIPVVVEIRPTQTGIPTSDIIPFSQKVMKPGDISISDMGDVPTRFTFDELVYLEQGQEYAVVILADTQEYEVFYAQMGEIVLGSRMSVSKQPHIGVMFTSQNGSTWSEHQNRDLKFNIYAAEFDTTEKTFQLECSPPELLPAPYNPLSTTSGSTQVVMNFPMHGLQPGIDRLSITNALGGNGFIADDINKTHDIVSTTIDTITFDMATAATITSNIGGDDVHIIPNYPASLINVGIDQFVPPDCEVSWSYQIRNMMNRNMSSSRSLSIGQNTDIPEWGVLKSADDLVLSCTFKSNKSNVSPVFDMDSAQVILVTTRIDSSNNEAIYKAITKDLLFSNISDTGILYFGMSLPGDSKLVLSIKRLLSSDEDVNSIPWEVIQPSTPLINHNESREYTYNITGVSFTGIKIKLEFSSSSPVNYPKVSDFRMIALA